MDDHNCMTTQCHPCVKVVIFGGLCVLPLAGTVAVVLLDRWLPIAIVLATYLVMSLLALSMYWWDKRQAREQGWRTPETTLHTVELLGGWPGALIAQHWFRHKTRKVPFLRVFWLIVMVHQVLWVIVCIWAALQLFN